MISKEVLKEIQAVDRALYQELMEKNRTKQSLQDVLCCPPAGDLKEQTQRARAWAWNELGRNTAREEKNLHEEKQKGQVIIRAIECYKQAAAIYPAFPEAYYSLGIAKGKQARNARAKAERNGGPFQVVEPDGFTFFELLSHERLLMQAHELYQEAQSHYQTAAQHFQNLFQESSPSFAFPSSRVRTFALCYNNLAIDTLNQALLATGTEDTEMKSKFLQALKLYDQAFHVQRTYSTGWDGQGVTFFYEGPKETGIPCYERLERALYADVQKSAAELVQKQRYERLQEYCQEIVGGPNENQEFPGLRPIALYGLALAQDKLISMRHNSNKEELKKVLALYESVIQEVEVMKSKEGDQALYPDILAWSHNNLAIIHCKHGDFNSAIQEFDKALKQVNGRFSLAWYGKSMTLFHQKRLYDALEANRHIDEKFVWRPYNEGMIKYQMGWFEEAAAAFKMAIKAQDTDILAYLGSGLAQYNSRSSLWERPFDEAIEVCNKIQEEYPPLARVTLQLKEIILALKNAQQDQSFERDRNNLERVEKDFINKHSLSQRPLLRMMWLLYRRDIPEIARMIREQNIEALRAVAILSTIIVCGLWMLRSRVSSPLLKVQEFLSVVLSPRSHLISNLMRSWTRALDISQATLFLSVIIFGLGCFLRVLEELLFNTDAAYGYYEQGVLFSFAIQVLVCIVTALYLILKSCPPPFAESTAGTSATYPVGNVKNKESNTRCIHIRALPRGNMKFPSFSSDAFTRRTLYVPYSIAMVLRGSYTGLLQAHASNSTLVLSSTPAKKLQPSLSLKINTVNRSAFGFNVNNIVSHQQYAIPTWKPLKLNSSSYISNTSPPYTLIRQSFWSHSCLAAGVCLARSFNTCFFEIFC